MVVVALYCGFRRRTIMGLEWRHLDLENWFWRIPGEVMKVGEDYDAAARLVAAELGFEVHGTISVLMRAIPRGLRTSEEIIHG